MNDPGKMSLLAATIFLLGLLDGCGQSRIQLGWLASNGPHHFEASYTTFSGCEVRTVRVDARGTLNINYRATVNRGTLAISVVRPDKETLWIESLGGSSDGVVQLPLEQDGRYAITVCGDDTAGYFDLSWKAE